MNLFGRGITVSGGLLRHYLSMRIIAGWLLTGIFIAGLTGLIRDATD